MAPTPGIVIRSFVAWLWLEAASTGKRVGHDVDSGNRPEGAGKIEVDCHELGKHRCKNVFSEKMTMPVVSTGRVLMSHQPNERPNRLSRFS